MGNSNNSANKIYSRILFFLIFSIFYTDVMDAQGWGRPRRLDFAMGEIIRQRGAQFLAGGEIQITSLSKTSKKTYESQKNLDYDRDTVQVKLIYYVDCAAKWLPNDMFPPVPFGGMTMAIWSCDACEYMYDTLAYSEEESSGRLTPLCTTKEGIVTKCDDNASGIISYRTMVFIDTVVLPTHASDWVFGHLLNTDGQQWQNFYNPTYYDGGIGPVQVILNPPPPPPPPPPPSGGPSFRSRVTGANGLQFATAGLGAEGAFYIEARYTNELTDGKYPGTQIERYLANTTPRSAGNPMLFACRAKLRQFNLGYYDIDGHYLKFTPIGPMVDVNFGDCRNEIMYNTKPITFINASASAPMGNASTYNVDSFTGNVTVLADVPVGQYKTAVKIEEFEDEARTIPIGKPIDGINTYTIRDIAVTIINTPSCKVSENPSSRSFFIDTPLTNFVNCGLTAGKLDEVQACAGNNISFDITSFYNGNVTGALPIIGYKPADGMDLDDIELVDPQVFKIYEKPDFDSATATFKWNIPADAEPGDYLMEFNIEDCIDDYILSRTKIVNIRINAPTKGKISYDGYKPVLLKDEINMPQYDTAFYCTNSSGISIRGENGKRDIICNWELITPGNKLLFDTGDIYDTDNSFLYGIFMLNNNIGDVQAIKLTSNQYCNNEDTIYVKRVGNMTPTVDIVDFPGMSKPYCFGDSVRLEVNGLPVTTSLTRYDWDIEEDVEFTEDPSKFSNIAIAKLVKKTNLYKVTVVQDYCIYPLDVDVDELILNGVRPRAVFEMDKYNVCPDDTINVKNLKLTTSICGLSEFSIPDRDAPMTWYGTPGGEVALNDCPKPFTSLIDVDKSKTQILYKASELKKMGFKAGYIDQIAFELEAVPPPTKYLNIVIKAKCTKLENLNDMIFERTDNFLNIGSYEDFTLRPGWIAFNINGFSWDGETNLLFDIESSCNFVSDDPTAVAAAPSFLSHRTEYTSIIGKYGKGRAGFYPAAISGFNVRPNIRFGILPFEENLKFQWEDITNKGDITILDYDNTQSANSIRNRFGSATPRIVGDYPSDIQYTISDTGNTTCALVGTILALYDTNYKVKLDRYSVEKCPGDTVHVIANSGKIKRLPLDLNCGLIGIDTSGYYLGVNDTGSLLRDSCRKYDVVSNPYFGISTADHGNTIQSPFGGVNANLGNPTSYKRVQILYPYTELKLMGLEQGIIRSISLEVMNKFANINKMNNFNVKIGCVGKNVRGLTKYFNSELLTVYENNSFETLVGINEIKLQSPYAWDGDHGLIVEISYSNLSALPYNADKVRATNVGAGNPYRKFLRKATRNGLSSSCENYDAQASAADTGILDPIRPNVSFQICHPTRVPEPVPSGMNWAPTTFISNTKINNPVIYNESTTKYFVIMDYIDTSYGQNRVECRVRDTFLSKVVRPEVEFNPKNPVACQFGDVQVAAGVKGKNQSLYSYEWDKKLGLIDNELRSPIVNISPPNEQYYIVKVSENRNPNCYSYDSVFVSIQEKSTMPPIGGPSYICNGDSVALSIPTQIGYKRPAWFYNGIILDSGFKLVVADTGEYYIEVDSGVCRNRSLVKKLSYREQQSVSLSDSFLELCEGESVEISYNLTDGVSNPQWNNGQDIEKIKVSQPGIYFLVNPRDQYGCLMKNNDSARIVFFDNPEFELKNDTICLSANQSVILTPEPLDLSSEYYWEPNNVTASSLEVTEPGEITVTRKRGSCEKTTKAVIVNEEIGVINLGKDKSSCCDEQYQLDGNPNKADYTHYKWSTGEHSQVVYTKPNVSGKYIVEAFKQSGCRDTGSIYIKNLCSDVQVLAEKPIINLGETNKLLGKHNRVGSSILYEWVPSESFNEIVDKDKLNAMARPKDTGDVEYVLVMTVIDSSTMPPKEYCKENAVARFKVLPNGVTLYNTITPNGDGINDSYYPTIKGVVNVNDYKVFNRYGQKLHDDPKTPWDGKFRGEAQPSGVYVGLIGYEVEEPKQPIQQKYEKVKIILVR